ncbi:MAG: sugar ABC transporter permease [Lachnospiraceae bacterium]|nr:sugar ABC transporter permease [Lachnospiraceae bacterium]
MNKLLGNKKAIAIFILPALIIYTVILIIPTGCTIVYSFCLYDPAKGPLFNGLGNYADLIADDIWWTAFINSMFFLVFSCTVQIFTGLILAFLLTSTGKGRSILEKFIFFPVILSSAVAGVIWMFLLSPGSGINEILEKFDINGPGWLVEGGALPGLPILMIAFVALWQFTGLSVMLYTRRISYLDKEMICAAYLDGCNRIKTFLYIEIPCLKRELGLVFFINALGALKYFDIIYNMTEGGPDNKTEVLATYIYERGFLSYDYGQASAASAVMLILCLIIAFPIYKVFWSGRCRR